MNANVPSQNPASAYDEKRSRCPVVHGLFPGLSVLGHAEVEQALLNPEVYSNKVSRHLSVPNGMDPPAHGPFRRLIEPYFGPEAMKAFAPTCFRISETLCSELPTVGTVEVTAALARPFALSIQCAFLGWPASMRDALWQWLQRNQEAIARNDRDTLTDNARVFEETVKSLIEERRNSDSPPEDNTTRLMREKVNGLSLSDAEIVSILRNWTAGEVGTISASVGILVAYLADHPDLQAELRAHPERLEEANDEILRLHAPLLTNRRITTCPASLGGESLAAGTPLTLVWAAANRDPKVFQDPVEFHWNRNPDKNLLWGRGIHVCPGAPLAKMELRMLMEALLRHWPRWEPGDLRRPAQTPAAGYEQISVWIPS
jgi:cytochrome P450